MFQLRTVITRDLGSVAMLNTLFNPRLLHLLQSFLDFSLLPPTKSDNNYKSAFSLWKSERNLEESTKIFSITKNARKYEGLAFSVSLMYTNWYSNESSLFLPQCLPWLRATLMLSLGLPY